MRFNLGWRSGPLSTTTSRPVPARSCIASQPFRPPRCVAARSVLRRQVIRTAAVMPANAKQPAGCLLTPKRASASPHFLLTIRDDVLQPRGNIPMKLDGKTALITGGASGIGRAIVLSFARHGARVICADINQEKAAEVTKEAESGNYAIESVAVDLADPKSARRCAEEVISRYARVDLLVNAAGWGDAQNFMDNGSDYMERVIAINLGGLIHLTQALLPPMIEARSGKIVNISSDAGRVGSSGETVYAAAKGGVIAFTKSLARELARYAINVNCVCPGPTDTPML